MMKRLGDYIRPVDVRNRDLKVTRLLGVSITKEFMPSIANIVGTDLSAYKVVTKGQFAYGPVTSRNGDKISVALLDGYDDAIISQAYTVFEVVDTSLDPEYLMMWFRRPEFDRYARFHSHGSAREVFDWEEMCEVQVPVPAIEKQRETVAEYNTLATRIETNKKLIATLEQTAQTLYIEHIENKKQKKCLLKNLCGFQEGYVNPKSSVRGFRTALCLSARTQKIRTFLLNLLILGCLKNNKNRVSELMPKSLCYWRLILRQNIMAIVTLLNLLISLKLLVLKNAFQMVFFL